MAEGIPPPEGCEEGDHAHTPWVEVKWGSTTSLEEKGVRAWPPSSLHSGNEVGLTITTLFHLPRREGQRS